MMHEDLKLSTITYIIKYVDVYLNILTTFGLPISWYFHCINCTINVVLV